MRGIDQRGHLLTQHVEDLELDAPGLREREFDGRDRVEWIRIVLRERKPLRNLIQILHSHVGMEAQRRPLARVAIDEPWIGAARSALPRVIGVISLSLRVLMPLSRLRDRKSTRLNSSHVKISYA